MIIILEGPDGAGKTTLAETLRQKLQGNKLVHIVKHGPYRDLTSEHLCKIYFRGMTPALTHDDIVIMDRSWLSEPIYGNAYRDGLNRIDTPRKRMLERVALSRGAVVINCLPDFETCLKTFKSRINDEYLDTPTQLQDVYGDYELLDLHTALPVIHYNYQEDSVDELLAHLSRATIENKASGGGCFNEGNMLMLCDRGPRANVKDSAVVVPFINFLDNDGPSRMLAATLDNEGVSESKLYWINTQTYQGVPLDPAFLKALRPSRIFALGNNAYTWALNNGIKVTKLPPPLHHMQHYPDEPYLITHTDHGNYANQL